MLRAEDCVALALAVLAIQRVWYEGGSPTARLERARAWKELRGHKLPLAFLGHLLLCPVCLPFYPACGLTLLTLRWPPFLDVVRFLAVVGLVHLLWDLHVRLTGQINNTGRSDGPS